MPLHGVAAELLAGFFDRKTFSFAANCLKSSLPVNNANLHFGNLAKGKPSGFNGCGPKHVSSAGVLDKHRIFIGKNKGVNIAAAESLLNINC